MVGSFESDETGSAKQYSGSELSVVARLKAPEDSMYEHVRVNSEVCPQLTVVRSGTRRMLEFSDVYSHNVPHSEFHNRVIRNMLRRAAVGFSHSVIAVHGLSTGRDDIQILQSTCNDVLAHSSPVVVNATLVRGEKAATDLLESNEVTLTRKITAQLCHTVARCNMQGTVLVTFTLQGENSSDAKLSLIFFEAAEKLTPASRRHPQVFAEIMKLLADSSDNDSLRICARQSRIIHTLHSSRPQAFSHQSSVLLIASSSLHLNNTAENVLRFASDLHHYTSHTDTTPQPLTALAIQKQEQYVSEKRKPNTSPSEALSLSESAHTVQRTTCDTTQARINMLESQLVECKSLLFQSREQQQKSENELLLIRQQLQSAESVSTQATQEVQRTNESKRRLQHAIAELEARLSHAESVAVQSEQKSADALVTQKQLQQQLNETLAQLSAAQQSPPSPIKNPPQCCDAEALRNDAHLLRQHLTEAEQHIRQLADEIADRSTQPEATRVLSRQLELRTEICNLNAAKAEKYERRLHTVLQGAAEDTNLGTADSERILLLESALDRAERAARKAELELQEVRLTNQQREVDAAAKLRVVTHQLEEARSAASDAGGSIEPDTSVIEEYVKDRSRILSELQLAKEEAQRSADTAAQCEAELQRRVEQNAKLQQTVAELQHAANQSHLNVSKLAETSLNNAQLQAETTSLREENRLLKQKGSELQRHLDTVHQEAADLREEADNTAAALNGSEEENKDLRARCKQYEIHFQQLHDSSEQRFKELSQSMQREREAKNEAQTQRDAFEAELVLIRQTANEERVKSCTLDVQRSQLTDECEALRSAVSEAQKRAAEHVNEVAHLQRELHYRNEHITKLSHELESAKERITTSDHTIRHLKEGAARRVEEDFSTEMEKLKEMETLAGQNKELKMLLQVKTAVVTNLETQLAQQVALVQEQRRSSRS